MFDPLTHNNIAYTHHIDNSKVIWYIYEYSSIYAIT